MLNVSRTFTIKKAKQNQTKLTARQLPTDQSNLNKLCCWFFLKTKSPMWGIRSHLLDIFNSTWWQAKGVQAKLKNLLQQKLSNFFGFER